MQSGQQSHNIEMDTAARNAIKMRNCARFTTISLKFSSVESENILKILKNNYGGEFNLLDNHDLLEGFAYIWQLPNFLVLTCQRLLFS